MEEENKIFTEVLETVEKTIKNVVDMGISMENVDFLFKLVDIHKDICNEDYWKAKKEDLKMRYRNYGRSSYGENRDMGDAYGRRSRDSRGRYKGEHALDEMYGNYQRYSEGKEHLSRGNYGAKNDTMDSLEYMLESVVDFVKMLEQDATSQDEVDLIRHYTKQISDM